MKKYFCMMLVLGLTTTTSHLHAGFLTQEEGQQAKALAKASTPFENYVQKNNDNNQQILTNWLTLEKFEFEYKNRKKTYYVGNSYRSSSGWGELALYKKATSPTGINLIPGEFSDLGDADRYLSNLRYEYIPAQNGQASHFIVEKVTTANDFQGKGYSQALLKYFLDEFVTKRTQVGLAFSDLRAGATKHYFPKYGFIKGTIPGYKFERNLHYPYYWIKK